MDKVNDGGQAFPRTGSYGRDAQEGMTLRDYFAAKAMAAFLCSVESGTTFGVSHPDTNLNCAMAAYAMADAMLRARGAQ